MRQPNQWSCLPTAFCIAMHVNFDQFINSIGHDGSEIIRPQFEDPAARRSFHLQECILAAMHWGYKPITLETEFALFMEGADDFEIKFDPDPYLKHCTLVALIHNEKYNYGHAVAVSSGKVHDPNGQTYTLEYLKNNFKIHTLVLL